jgi:hypothetical protein
LVFDLEKHSKNIFNHFIAQKKSTVFSDLLKEYMSRETIPLRIAVVVCQLPVPTLSSSPLLSTRRAKELTSSRP